MFYLKSEEHLVNIGKSLYEDKIFSDLLFITDGATFHAHSSLLFSYLPSLTDLVCDGYKYGHHDLVFFLPGVHKNSMELALQDFYTRCDPTKLAVILNVRDVPTQQDVTELSSSISDPAGKEISNITADCIESEITDFADNNPGPVAINDEIGNNVEEKNLFDFNNFILEVCSIIENLNYVDKTKYVKVFEEKDGEASIGILHTKVKILARKMSTKLSPIPHSVKDFPRDVKTGCKTFTKQNSTSSIGLNNTTSGYCMLVNIQGLSLETRDKVWRVLGLYCTFCDYESTSGTDLQSHVKEKHKETIQFTTGRKQKGKDELTDSINDEQENNIWKMIEKKQKKVVQASKKSNCYLVFVEERRPIVKQNFPTLTSIQVTQKISEEWQNLSKEEKKMYRRKSAMINAEITTKSNNIFSCSKCRETFLRQEDVTGHLMSKHVDLVGQEVKREEMPDSELLQIIENKINMGFIFD